MDRQLFQLHVEHMLVPGRKASAGPKTLMENIEQPILVRKPMVRQCEICLKLVKDPRTYIMTNQIGPGKKPKKVFWIEKCLVCGKKVPYNNKSNK